MASGSSLIRFVLVLWVASCRAWCEIWLEDSVSGDLFVAYFVHSSQPCESLVETVLNSLCYFVLWIKDDRGKHTLVGLSFTKHNEMFDFNVILNHEEYMRWEHEK